MSKKKLYVHNWIFKFKFRSTKNSDEVPFEEIFDQMKKQLDSAPLLSFEFIACYPWSPSDSDSGYVTKGDE